MGPMGPGLSPSTLTLHPGSWAFNMGLPTVGQTGQGSQALQLPIL